MNAQDKGALTVSTAPTVASLLALDGVPQIRPGADLSNVILVALAATGQRLQNGDILVIAQKIVSKAENRSVLLSSIQPSDDAIILAREVGKDPRLVELILRESTEIVSSRKEVLVVAHRLGFVMANAGIDLSNVDHSEGECALLLPEDPDGTCMKLRLDLKNLTGVDVGIIISDSHGRAFRNGTVGVAIGLNGFPGLLDLRGMKDLYGRPLQSTEVGIADEIASAASLLMGQANEAKPIVIVRGIARTRADGSSRELVRPKTIDLFRKPTAEAVLHNRRSVRRYLETPVPRDVLDSILESATRAPSAHNRQPWRFAVLVSSELRVKLAASMAERLRHDRTQDGDDPSAIEADAARSIARISEAPLVIVACLTMAEMDEYPDKRRKDAECIMAIQGTAMAVQNLLLAATAAGLGSNIMCGPLFCADTVRNSLGLPLDWQPQCLVTLGYPKTTGKRRERRPLGDVVRVFGDLQ